ncbi:Spermidine-binding periplasmic protein SpuE [Azospirillaceae bacterium]
MSIKTRISCSAMFIVTIILIIQATLFQSTPSIATETNKVRIYNWSDYIGVDTLANFTKDVGLETNYDLYDNLELLEQKLLAGHSGYDVVVPGAEPTFARLIKTKAVQPIDKKKIPNLINLDPDLMKRLESIDPGNKYGVIYQWGTIGLGMLPDKIKSLYPDAPLDSWDILFKPENVSKLAKCGVTLMDSAADVLPSVLHYLGLDPNSEKADDLKKAEDLLRKIRPHIKAFVSGQNIHNLANGGACLAFGYSGDMLQAKVRAKEAKNGVAVEYVSPKEGVQIWFDVLAIPTDAPNLDGAHKFINYVLQSRVVAGISNVTQYANAVPASWPMIDAEIRSNGAVFLSSEARAKMFVSKAVSLATERLRRQIWTRIKIGVN